MTDDPAERPTVALLPGHQKRALHGHPWIFSNEVQMDAAAKALPPGSLVTLKTGDGRVLGVATFNPHTLVAARLLDRDAGRCIDLGFFAKRLKRALAIRERLYEEPYYRLVHAEADAIPGAVVDRFGDVVVAQLNTAGMTRLEPELLAALEAVVAPKAIVLRNDSPARALEGLSEEVRVAAGTLSGAIELRENGARFEVDPLGGQKTGWFYDQRDNRKFMAKLASGARVLDLYCFVGGFAIEAAVAGAADVTGIDRSEPALALAAKSAALNGAGERCTFRRGEVFAELQTLAGAGVRFDLVISDPPAFVKSRKDLGPGLRGYRKLARLAAGAVAPQGYLFLASCSHNVTPEEFWEAARRGLEDAGRNARLLRSAGAAPDHPVHPNLPESAYLKALVLALD
ncbi:MAG TPA: class I SAM-dependent rRNA methyltransferase [Stellaceae bacterium]|nr:class I SAM-dependent rRNA methyltransferase [Stellaceae bacterium]